MDQVWIDKNQKIFKGIEKNQIYFVFENEKPIKEKAAGGIIYKSFTSGKKGKKITRSKRVSKKGNLFITKIAICECGTQKASKKLRKAECKNCLHDYRKQGMINRYYKNKTKKVDNRFYLRKYDKLYENLEQGVIYCLFGTDELLKLKNVCKIFGQGRKRISPVTGAKYNGRLCLCKECGKKRFSKKRLSSYCSKCQDNRNTAKSEAKKKKGITAKQIAFEITGDYRRVSEAHMEGLMLPDVYDGVDMEINI